jgi:poly-gamma-glutamate synthesis protein (capsule biosynthesis protein)
MNGDLLRRRAFAFLCFIASAFLLTCVTDSPPQAKEPPRPPLVLTFAGDIMAHTVNFMMDDYRRIYEDLRPVLTADDLSFGNLETPVADSLPMSTFPSFNVHSAYLRAAVDGGFDVFSLANNHANDHASSVFAAPSPPYRRPSSRVSGSPRRDFAR